MKHQNGFPFPKQLNETSSDLAHLNWTFPNSQSVADHFGARLLKHLSGWMVFKPISVDVATQIFSAWASKSSSIGLLVFA